MIEKMKGAMVGLGAGWVLWLMLGLSVISLAVMLERAWLYWSLRDDMDKLMRELARLLRSGDMDGARRRLEASPSAEAAVVVAGLVESDQGVESAEEAMAGASALQRLKLEKRLAYLGTLGNNAPFIGLLGTVIGVVGAYDELAHPKSLVPAGPTAGGQAVSDALMAHIAEALVATAVGLVVAIPAVAAYNSFQRIVRSTVANTDALGHVLLAHLKSNPIPALADGPSATSSADGHGKKERASKPTATDGDASSKGGGKNKRARGGGGEEEGAS